MALQFIEHETSRATVAGRSPKATLRFKAYRECDEMVVRRAFFVGNPGGTPPVEPVAPITYDGLLLLSGSVDPKGNGVWECVAEYGLGEQQSPNDPNTGGTGGPADSHQPQPNDPMGPECTFDTTGGTQKLYTSIGTRAKAKGPLDTRPIPDTKLAIGVHESEVDGVDVPAPSFKWQETWTFPLSAITWNYAARLCLMTGRSNNATFRGFKEQEVAFLGASGSPNGTQKYRVTYQFTASPNRTGAFVDDSTGGIVAVPGWPALDKKGQHYLWVMYEPGVQDGKLMPVPRAVYVEQVLYTDDFKKLGIGS